MQVADGITVPVQALIGWTQLPVPEQQQVLNTLSTLRSRPPDEWPTDEVVRLGLPDPTYMLRAANGLRVFFRREDDGQFTILTLALQEMLDRYFSGGPNPRQRHERVPPGPVRP